MSNHKNKIDLLNQKINKLNEQKLKIVQRRKVYLGDLCERLELLTVSDACLAGGLMALKQTLSSNPQQIKQWEQNGLQFVRQRPLDVESHQAAIESSNSNETATN